MQGVAIEREQTRKFIAENPVNVVLTRRTKVADGAGGSRDTTLALPAQRMRAIPQRSGVSVERRTVNGVTVTPDLVLQGEHNCDIQRGDWFTYNGIAMEVVWVTTLPYEKLAEVTMR